MTRTRPNLRVLGYTAQYRGVDITLANLRGGWNATAWFEMAPVRVVTGDTEVEALDAACDLIDAHLGPEVGE
jgi:hypothetical protein